MPPLRRESHNQGDDSVLTNLYARTAGPEAVGHPAERGSRVTHVLLVKRICILTLSFLFLSSVFANLCSATSSSFLGADQAHHLKDQSHSQHDHEQSPHKDKSPCHKSLLCCPSLTQGSSSYSFVLDARLATPVEIFSKPFEMAELVYHPPENRL